MKFITFIFSLLILTNLINEQGLKLISPILVNSPIESYSEAAISIQEDLPLFEVIEAQIIPEQYAIQRTAIIRLTIANQSVVDGTNVIFLIALPPGIKSLAGSTQYNPVPPLILPAEKNISFFEQHYPEFGANQTVNIDLPVQISLDTPLETFEITLFSNSDQTEKIRAFSYIFLTTSLDVFGPPTITKITSTPAETVSNLLEPDILTIRPRMLITLVVGGGIALLLINIVGFVYVIGRKERLIKQKYFSNSAYQTKPNLNSDQMLSEVTRKKIKFYGVGKSDIGRVRSLNEDSWLIREQSANDQTKIPLIGFYAVADGLGGHTAGDIASRLTIETLNKKLENEIFDRPSIFLREDSLNPQIWLRDGIMAANETVFKERRQTKTKMASTLVAAMLVEQIAHIAHIGDSRAYLIRKKTILSLTKDHSHVQELIDSKKITPEQARRHPKRGAIYRTIGTNFKAKPDFTKKTVIPGDQLLLCSDGLCGLVSDDDILQIVLDSKSTNEACDRLINAANSLGGEDNITVLIIQIESARENN